VSVNGHNPDAIQGRQKGFDRDLAAQFIVTGYFNYALLNSSWIDAVDLAAQLLVTRTAIQ